MKLTFGRHEMVLHHAGILLWPKHDLLVVSDLHLEKGSHFARRGFFLPPYDSRETIRRLMEIIEIFTPKRIVLLGDSFHDHDGYARLKETDRQQFEALRVYDPVWVNGNHEAGFVPPGFEGHDAFTLDNITFRHEAEESEGFEISGHYHPKLNLVHKGGRIASPCFLYMEQKLILPAFGAYTGGLSVHDKAMQCFYEDKAATAYVLGQNRIYSVTLNGKAQP